MRRNFNQLPVLEALLEQRNLTRVAEQLHMTQSAVSKTLAQLRESFDDELLVRDGQKYLLTPKAEELKGQLPDVMQSLEALYKPRKFDPAICARKFVMASSDYVAQYIFPDIAEEVARQAPLASLEFRLWEPAMQSNFSELPIDLVSTIIDVPPESASALYQGQDGLAVLMGKHHPLADQSISLEQYLQYSHLKVSGGGDKDTLVDRELEHLGYRRNCLAVVPFFQSAVATLGKTNTLLTTPLHIAAHLSEKEPLCFTTLPLELPCQRYHLFWHQRFDDDPDHRWFRRLALSFLKGSFDKAVSLGMA